jgi:hypothetical protein
LKKVVFFLLVSFYAFSQTGIGTTTPVNKFQIEATVADPLTSGSTRNGHLRLSGTGFTHAVDAGLMSTTSNFGSWIQARKSNDYSINYNLLLNPNGGSVGIGNVSPFTTLTVGNASGTIPGEISLNPTSPTAGEGGQITLKKSLQGGTVDWTIDQVGTSSANARLRIFSGSSETSGLAILENGYMGIGTISPAATLDVNGNVTNSAYNGTLSGFSANLNSPSSGTTSYTLASSDNGKILNFTGSSAITITVPISLTTGFNCMIIQNGTGQITISPAATVTINNRNNFTKTAGQYAILTIVHLGSNTFITSGEMSN